jgi:AcrR family transcriptional regulator
MTSVRHTPEDEAAVAAATAAATGPAEREVPAEVLAAVRDSVLAVGVRRTTLTDVARRAGVSRMTLYRMVPDVETLLLELMTRELGGLLADVEASVTRRRTARSRLVASMVGVARRLPEEPLFRRVLEVDPELLLPYLTDRIGSTQRIGIGHLRRGVAEGHADRSVRRGDLDVMALSLLVMVTSMVVSARLLDSVGREAALRELERGLDGWLRP